MRHLITGGAGFLGSNLIREMFHRRPYDSFVVVDNFSTPGSRANAAELIRLFADAPGWDKRLFVFERDLLDGVDDLGEFQRIWHLASLASPPLYQAKPLETFWVNTRGTALLCELAVKHGARLLFASTSEVYGDPEVHPQPESYLGAVSTQGIRACYDEGKRGGEAIVSIYARESGLDARIARIFNTFGPRMSASDGRVVTNFIRQALRGEPLTIYGSGEQTRSLCYVDDMINGLRFLMQCRDVDHSPVNLGDPDNEISVLELAQKICQLTGELNSAGLEFQELPQDDPKVRQPDIMQALQLGWRGPQASLSASLAATVAWHRTKLEAPVESV